MITNGEFITFVELALRQCKNTFGYNSKFSKKTYNNHQKRVILLLNQK